MRIAKIWKNDYPWDVRVEKICTTLLDADHEVHLICSNIKKRKIRENIDRLQIHRLPILGNDTLNRASAIPVFFNPFWFYKLLRIVKNEKIEAIMVRDLPLVITGLVVGKIYRIPVIFDMAENYPAMWDDIVDRKGLKFYNYLLKNPAIADILERYVIKRVDHIIVVIEESQNRIKSKGALPSRLSILSNTPDLHQFPKSTKKIERHLQGKFNLVYTGSIDSGRGLDTVIKSLSILSEKISNICFVVVGDGTYLPYLKKLANRIGVERYVYFKGWVDFSCLLSYISCSDMGVIPHNVTKQMNTTIPNKLFDYMAYRKPVIVSDAAPLKRIVEETNCGVVFRSRDSASFVDKVLELKDASLRRQMGENGYHAVKSKYNWSKESAKLIEIFRTLKSEKKYLV